MSIEITEGDLKYFPPLSVQSTELLTFPKFEDTEDAYYLHAVFEGPVTHLAQPTGAGDTFRTFYLHGTAHGTISLIQQVA